jgi:hypothetical protein
LRSFQLEEVHLFRVLDLSLHLQHHGLYHGLWKSQWRILALLEVSVPKKLDF